jgi:hypothetical protein
MRADMLATLAHSQAMSPNGIYRYATSIWFPIPKRMVCVITSAMRQKLLRNIRRSPCLRQRAFHTDACNNTRWYHLKMLRLIGFHGPRSLSEFRGERPIGLRIS